MNRDWPRLQRSGILGAQILAIDLHSLRAACGLAALAAGVAGPAPQRAVKHSVKQLEKMRRPWTAALAKLIRAGAIAAGGDRQSAAAGYRLAMENLTAARMLLHAAVAKRRLGEVLGDETMIADADAALIGRGAARPDKLADLLAPPCFPALRG